MRKNKLSKSLFILFLRNVKRRHTLVYASANQTWQACLEDATERLRQLSNALEMDDSI